MPSTVAQWILTVAPIPLGVAGVVGVVRFRRLDATMRGLLALVGCGLLMETVAHILQWQHRPNIFLTPLDAALEFALIAWMYRRTLQPWPLTRYLPAIIGLFWLFTVVSYVLQSQLVQFSPVQRFIESLLVLLLVLLYFYKLGHDEVVFQLEREPMFWVSAGLLLYFAGNVLIFISSNYLLQFSQQLNQQVWAVHAVLYMLLCSCYTLALWLSPRTSK
jgi:hypothetical protein